MEPLFERHNFVYMKKKIDFPLIKNKVGDIVPGIIAGAAGDLVTGTPVAGIAGFVAGYISKGAISISTSKVKDLINQFRRLFGFNKNDFVLMIGYRKDINKQLVTMEFEPIVRVPEAKAEIDRNDREISEKLASTIGLYKDQKLYDQDELNEKEDDFMNDILRKDVLSVGGPIPLDPLYDVMIQKDVLPCNYELKKPLIYPPEETGISDKTFYKYEIVTNEGDIFEPQWNQLNYGIITRVDKDLILHESDKGVFFNFSGCQWFGTKGTCTLFLNKGSIKSTIKQIRKEIGKKENFQAIVSVPIDKQTKIIKENEIKIESVFKIR